MARVLAAGETCPGSVFEFPERLLQAGARIDTTLVNNQGSHNPQAGNATSLKSSWTDQAATIEMTKEPARVPFGHLGRAAVTHGHVEPKKDSEGTLLWPLTQATTRRK